MPALKKSPFTALLAAAALSSGLFSATANAAQFVADLVPQQWLEINRSVDVRQKLYSTNLYGATAEVQVNFKDNGVPTPFTVDQLAVNSESFNCRGTQAGDLLGTLDPATTQVCTFVPKLLLNNGIGGTEAWPEYWMRIKIANAANRSVTLRHRQPVAPQCDNSAASGYNPLNSCTTVVSDLTFAHNQIIKPRVSYNSLLWAPLAVKNKTYRVTLDVRRGKVALINGLKLKVSGSLVADPNDELLDGADFTTPNCILEKGGELAIGVYTCDFVAADHGFIHIPLQRVGLDDRRVITTITRL